MATVFAWAETDAYSKSQPQNFRKEMKPLTAAFSGVAPEAIDQARVTRYVEDRTKENYAEATIRGELHRLGAVMRAYNETHDPKLPIDFSVGRSPVKKVMRILTRGEAIALMAATHNLVPLPGWGLEVHGAELPRTLPSRQTRAHLARYILLALMTGCTEACARSLMWAPGEGGKISFVDLEAGLLHRLGPDASRFEKFAGTPVRIPRSLLRLMRHWRRADARRGISHVIHLPEGGAARADLAIALGRLTAEVGLDDVNPQTLIDTCAATALQRGAPLYGVAIMLSLNPVVTRRRYDHFRHDFQERQMQALDNPLTS